MAPLVAAYKKEVQSLLNEGFHLKWEAGSKLESYVRRLADSVIALRFFSACLSMLGARSVVFFFDTWLRINKRDKVDELLVKYEKIVQCLDQLGTCPIHGLSLQKIAQRLQEAVDDLNLAGYSNLDAWVRRLDKQLETILTNRLHQALGSWISTFSSDGTTSSLDLIPESDLTKGAKVLLLTPAPFHLL